MHQAPPPFDPPHKATRVTIDYSVPLWGIMTVVGTGLLLLIAMYFTLQQLGRNVDELQITVRSGNTSVSVLASEVALLKFRMSTSEDDLRRLNEIVRTQQQNKAGK